MFRVSKYGWSLSSIGVTVGVAVITLSIIQNLHRRGMWRPESSIATGLAGVGGIAVLVSFILAAVGIAKEKPSYAGILALCLSLLSFLLYVQ
jgi:hypothetical protein